jgi:hypothetical protein
MLASRDCREVSAGNPREYTGEMDRLGKFIFENLSRYALPRGEFEVGLA